MQDELERDVQRFAYEVEHALPPPSKILLYNGVSPGFADRIMRMAEASIQERREIKKKAILANRFAYLTGTLGAFGLALIAVAGGVYCALHGAQFAGGIIGSSGLLASIVASVLNQPRRGRLKASQDRKAQSAKA